MLFKQLGSLQQHQHVDGSVRERHNSSALAMELRYVFLAQTHIDMMDVFDRPSAPNMTLVILILLHLDCDSSW